MPFVENLKTCLYWLYFIGTNRSQSDIWFIEFFVNCFSEHRVQFEPVPTKQCSCTVYLLIFQPRGDHGNMTIFTVCSKIKDCVYCQNYFCREDLLFDLNCDVVSRTKWSSKMFFFSKYALRKYQMNTITFQIQFFGWKVNYTFRTQEELKIQVLKGNFFVSLILILLLDWKKI